MRQRGPKPLLLDSEIITMQVVGEFLGMDGDKNIWEYFGRNWRTHFPRIGDRTTFVKQARNLWYWTWLLQEKIAAQLGAKSDALHITDGFPIPVAHFKRAHFSRVFKGQATYGFCAAKSESYYGFKGHIVISSIGVVSGFTIASANIDERDVLPENILGLTGIILGDKGLMRPSLTEELAQTGLSLQHPVRSNMKKKHSEKYLSWMKSTRRLVETVIGQLAERFRMQKTRARNLLTISLRVTRKILAHTLGLFVNHSLGRPILQLEGLVA